MSEAEAAPAAAVAEKPVPQNIRNLHTKAIAALERNVDLALDMLMRCVKACPWFLEARRNLRKAEIGRYLQKSGGKVASGSGLAGLLAKIPAQKVRGLVKKGQNEEALYACEELLLKEPLNVNYVKLFAETAIAAGYAPEGLMTMEVAREHIPATDPEALETLGRLYIQTKDYKKALECLRRVLRLKPQDGEIARLVKDTEALDTINSGWQQAHDAGDYRKTLANAAEAEKLEQKNKSVKSASDADALIAENLEKIEREPKNVNYRLALVGLYLQQKRYAEGLAAIDAARGVIGEDPELDRRYAAVKTEMMDEEIAQLKESGADAETLEAKETERNQYVFNDIYERVQRYPNDQHLHFLLGQQYATYGYPDEAIQQFQISQRSARDRVQSLNLMAGCFRQKNMLDMAVEQLNAALEQLPTMDATKMDVYYQLGEICEEEGDIEASAKYFKEIYRADATYKDISARVQHIYDMQAAAKAAAKK